MQIGQEKISRCPHPPACEGEESARSLSSSRSLRDGHVHELMAGQKEEEGDLPRLSVEHGQKENSAIMSLLSCVFSLSLLSAFVLQIAPYDRASKSSFLFNVALQCVLLCMLIFLIISGIMSLVAYFKEPLPPNTQYHGFGFRFLSYFFDDLFNLLDLSLLVVFGVALFLWLSFSLSPVHSVVFHPSGDGFSFRSSSSSGSKTNRNLVKQAPQRSLLSVLTMDDNGLDTAQLPQDLLRVDSLSSRTLEDLASSGAAASSLVDTTQKVTGDLRDNERQRKTEDKNNNVERRLSSTLSQLSPGVDQKDPSRPAINQMPGTYNGRGASGSEAGANVSSRVGSPKTGPDGGSNSTGDGTQTPSEGEGEGSSPSEPTDEERRKLYEDMNTLFASIDDAYRLLDVYIQLCGAVVALSFIRTLRLFEKRKRMVILFFTVSEAAENLLFVFFGVFFLYLGLVLACYLSFGFSVGEYASVRSSFVSTFLLLLGCFSISDLFAANRPVAGMIIFPYLFMVGVVCLGCFLAVLLRSFVARLGEVETAEAFLSAATGDCPPRTLSESLLLFLRELTCRASDHRHASTPASSSPPGGGGAGGEDNRAGQDGREGGGEEGGGVSNYNYDTESVDEFGIMQEIDEKERKRRNKPIKVAEIPKEVFTTQLTDDQWNKLPPKVREWALYEVGEFIDVFRKLEIQSNLAGTRKLLFIQQTEKTFYEKVLALDKETQQQEAHLSHRLAVYKNQVLVEQEKISNYTRYLEQALDDRQRELEMLRREFDLIQTKAEEMKEEEERRRAMRHANRDGFY